MVFFLLIIYYFKFLDIWSLVEYDSEKWRCVMLS